MEKIITLYHRNKTIKTIEDFMEREKIYGIKPEDFLNFNKELIWQQLSEADKKVISVENGGKWPTSSSDIKLSSTLPCPCVLRIQPEKVTAELAINLTNFQSDKRDFYAFAHEKIQNILQNEGYVIDEVFSKQSLDCRVFGWFKSLYFLGQGKNKVRNFNRDDSEFSDLSKYIISLATTVAENGGSFSIKLPIIKSQNMGFKLFREFVRQKNADIVSNVGVFGNVSKTLYEFGKDEYYSKSDFNSIESNYFNWLISSNDLIFISFEKLEMEHERGSVEYVSDNFSVDAGVQEHVYDMIGLVDEVRVVTGAQNADGYVEIVGRDLMKLIIEDGTFFFNPSTTSGPSQVFQNDVTKRGDVSEADFINGKIQNPMNRVRLATGEIDVFTNRQDMDIAYIIKGVISQLINIEIIPGHVFDSWGDDRTKIFELIPKEK